ncbi:putative WEB family protein At4g17210 [Phalaenopsis equestris]|uniref:putative WEB family protein At4g17210 n=1 Tax=Phalaenopsis equestris TaxID=78828 RepID=UPI0009E405AD|nr:putative WEB family protein At4g17210 [Phalaenopsis equestris]XP_020593597.1 putative WEB family protein At4g17210 [Phalaenopsis equestris]
MEEIYTKPFESVQAAITLFEQKIDPKKSSSSSNKGVKGGFLKDLTDSSLLLEATEHEKSLGFFEFDASSKSPEELLALLKLCKAERDNYKEKFRKSQALFLEYEKRYHFFPSVSNLEAVESRTARMKAEMMKTELIVEEEGSQELLKHTSEIKKFKFSSQRSNIEATKHSSAFCGEIEEDLEASGPEVFQSEIQLQFLKRHFAEMEFLEIELLKQIIMSEYLHVELKQSKEAQFFFSKDIVKSENELMKRVDSGNEKRVLEIKEEGKRMKEDLNFPWEKINGAEGAKTKLQKPFEKENEEASFIKNNAFTMLDSDGFCAGITISMEEYEFLIQKSEIANQTKGESSGEYDVKELKRELEDKNSEISELRCLLEEAERRAELAEKAKMVVESQLRKWRDQRRLRRAASDAVKDYGATKNDVNRQHEKPLLSKLACINPEAHGHPPHPKRSASVHDGRKSKHIPLGKLLKMKF